MAKAATDNKKKRNFVTPETYNLMNATTWPEKSDAIEGVFIGERNRDVTDTQTGEMKTITDILLKGDEGSNNYAIPKDAGLKVALSEFNVQEGQYVELKKLVKKNLGAKRVNQYAIRVATL